jgi:multidrug efflux system outer membrane protein
VFVITRTTVLLSFVAILAACGQTQEFVRPTPPVPQQWPTTAGAKGSQEAPKVHWKTYFPDPRLQSLIATALQNNRDIRIAAARVSEARAQYALAKAERLPFVNLLGSGTFTGTPNDLVNAGTPSSFERYDASISSMSYEIDFWGRLASLSEAAKNTFLATQEAQRAVQASLVAEVASTYFSWVQLEESAQLASATVATRELALNLVGKGRDAGGSYDFEVEQAASALESARAGLDSLEHQINIAQNRLNYLVGEAPAALPIGLRLHEQGFDIVLTPGLPSEVLLLRPDVIAAEQRLRAAQANIEAARAAFLPKVVLTAGLGVASQGLGTLFSGAAWNFAPTLAMPLFDGGRLAASKDLAEVRKVIAVAEYEKTIQLAFREVSDLLSARAALVKQMRSAEINEKAQAKRLEISMARNKVGLSTYLDVLDGQREWVAAQQGTAQLRRAQLETAAQLYKALGGGA